VPLLQGFWKVGVASCLTDQNLLPPPVTQGGCEGKTVPKMKKKRTKQQQ
jgi:hypothetical protein